jgi:hypothetical protein
MRLALTGSVGLFTTTLALCFGASLPSVKTPAPASAHHSYRLTLGPFVVSPGASVGLIVRARINGGPLLRLLLDSGTQYVALDRKTAMKSGCTGGPDLEVVGAGAPSAELVKAASASTVEIADLTLRNVPILITAHRLADGIDGALPLSLFAGFLIRLDVPARTLDLLPYPLGQADATGAVRAVSSNELLFLKGVFNDRYEGYFLLDTGAAYTTISQKLNRQLDRFGMLSRSSVSVQGGTTAMDAPLFADSARLRVGSRELATGPVLAVDLSTASRYHNLEVSGLIGYPALRDSVLMVNYRDGLVRIDPK